MVINERKFKNIPSWFVRYVQNPLSSGVSRYYIDLANKFMEDNKIIRVDCVVFSDKSYKAKPALGDIDCPCYDMKVIRYICRDCEKRFA